MMFICVPVANSCHYADNDPLNKTDPLGLCPVTDNDFEPTLLGDSPAPTYGVSASMGGGGVLAASAPDPGVCLASFPGTGGSYLPGIGDLFGTAACFVALWQKGEELKGGRSGDGSRGLTDFPECGKSAFRYFRKKGLTKEQSAGVVGNLAWESGMNPYREQDGGGPGRGLAQWETRWADLETFAGTRSPYNFRVQLNFVWYELTTYSYYGLDELRAAGDVETATRVFLEEYEKASAAHLGERIDLAREVLSRWG